MKRYAIAFINNNGQLVHKVISSEDKESALRTFFEKHTDSFYSMDDKGFYYFKEDFFLKGSEAGSIIEIK